MIGVCGYLGRVTGLQARHFLGGRSLGGRVGQGPGFRLSQDHQSTHFTSLMHGLGGSLNGRTCSIECVQITAGVA